MSSSFFVLIINCKFISFISACLMDDDDGESIECILQLHYKKGITINETRTGRIMYRISFRQLCSTHDDGNKMITFIYDQDRKVIDIL